MAGARYTVVAANLFGVGDSTLFPPYTVVRRGGIRVAIGGLTTPGAMVWDRDHLRGHARVAPIGAVAPSLLRAMRADADVSVVLIHSGMDGESTYDTAGVGPENVAATLAAGPARPDVVVVGHSHREMVDSVIAGVHFVQPRAFARSVAVVHLSLRQERDGWHVTAVHADRVLLDRESESPTLVRRLAPTVDLVNAWIRQPVGVSVAAFPAQGVRAGPTPLMGFVGEAERRTAHADLAAVSAFNTVSGLPAGEIHRADLYGLYPYENTLRAIRISGAQLRAYLEYSARYFRAGPDGRVAINDSVDGYNFDMVWGADYEIDLSRPVGQRIAALSVNGRPVAPADSFTLAINDYRQKGGGGYAMIAGAPATYDRGESVRGVLEAAAGRDTLHPRDYARENWRIVPDPAAAQVRGLFGLSQVARAAVPADTVQLRVLAVGPLRGRLDALPALKAALDAAAARCDCAVLRVAAGDLLEGTRESDLVHGQSMVEGLNRLGLAATAVGASDTDWSADTLQRRMAGSRFAWLTANVVEAGSGRRPDWAVPYRVLTVGGRRVGVVGVTGGIDSLAHAVGAVRDAASAARADGATLVVLLGSGDLSPLLAALPPGSVDVAADGAGRDSTVNGIPLLGGAPAGAAVSRVDLVRTVVGGREFRRGADTVQADRVRPDSGELSLLARYAPLVDSAAAVVVARAKLPLARAGAQSPVGNLVADAWRNALRSELAIVADSELRADLPAGPITVGALRDFVGPYATLRGSSVSGAAFREYLETALAAGGAPALHVAGVAVTYDSTAPAGRRVKEVRLADGSKLRDKQVYLVATSGAVTFPGPALRPPVPGPRAVDALTNYLRALPQPVEAPDQRRLAQKR
jgi:2',3'-cyclic-nucleotide 2'-phosphodiesterase/3'-nucleotidase